MPAIFASHDDFKDWFSNPLTGMVEGSIDFNADVVQRLRKVSTIQYGHLVDLTLGAKTVYSAAAEGGCGKAAPEEDRGGDQV